MKFMISLSYFGLKIYKLLGIEYESINFKYFAGQIQVV